MKRHMLLIDDDWDDRDLFSQACTLCGITCTTMGEGSSMLTKLDRGEISRPDIMFLDVNMPLVNGWQCLKLLKDSIDYRDIPVIMYSTSGHAEEVEKAKALGALCFFMKPDDFFVLQQGLSTVLDYLEAGKLDSLVHESNQFM